MPVLFAFLFLLAVPAFAQSPSCVAAPCDCRSFGGPAYDLDSRFCRPGACENLCRSYQKGGRGSAPAAAPRKKKQMSFDQQVGLMFMQSFMDAMVNSMLAPPPKPAAPPPPPPPQYAENPVYADALKRLSEAGGSPQAMRQELVAELAAVPEGQALTREVPAARQLLASACLGKAASAAGGDDERELLLRQSADALSGGLYPAGAEGCGFEEPKVVAPAVLEKRRRAAELAADFYERAGELTVRSEESQARAERAEAAVAEAEKAVEQASAPQSDRSFLEAAKAQEEAARKELAAAKEEAERLAKESKEATEKARGLTDKLGQAGQDEGKLDALFSEFGP